jgi:uncharacterized protein (DUF488 family)
MGNSPEPAGPRQTLFTIGHSNHEWPSFLQLLRQARVTAIADVRSSPYSRRLPQYSRETLERGLRDEGITYVYLGDLLGGRPPDEALYGPEGRVDYEKVRQTESFRRGVARLLSGMERYCVAMLCAEDDPLDCHRGLMIAPTLRETGISPAHIRGDGTLEDSEQMERRLLECTGLGGEGNGLFAATLSQEERGALLREAYRRRALQKAYQADQKADR